jgi:hypothetical protein
MEVSGGMEIYLCIACLGEKWGFRICFVIINLLLGYS